MYPASAAARDRFILDRRQPMPRRDPSRHQGVIVEDERTEGAQIVRSATVFLTGRECPWRCAMCDLWQYTIAEDTPAGAIPVQVAAARDELRKQGEVITRIKLYNAGSFFDPRAVPEADYDAVAAQLGGLDRVVVESHPSLVGRRLDRFLEALNRRGSPCVQLEVAMGLETVHPEALERLNKRMTVNEFALAARRLKSHGAALRAFLLISPPFVPCEEQDDWLSRSIAAAFSFGAAVVSLIPTRSGNGAVEALREEGAFHAPTLEDIERSIELAIAARPDRGSVFVDLWDLQRFSSCPRCFEARRARLHTVNLGQQLLPRPSCDACRPGATS